MTPHPKGRFERGRTCPSMPKLGEEEYKQPAEKLPARVHAAALARCETAEALRERHVGGELASVVAHIDEGSKEVRREEAAKDLAVSLRREDEAKGAEDVRDKGLGGSR